MNNFKSIILITLSLLFFASISLAQSSVVDSLKNELQKAKHDTSVLKILNDISKDLQSKSDYSNAMKYADAAKERCERLLAKNAENKQSLIIKRELARALINIANANNSFGNYPEAMKGFFTALKICEDIDFKKGIAACNNNIALIYYRQGNNVESLKFILFALKIFQEIGDKSNVSLCYNNIAGINIDQRNYAEALKNLFASVKIREEIGDKHGMANLYDNIGTVQAKQSNYEEALKSHFAALKIREAFKDQPGMVKAYNNIGSAYASLGNYREALSWLNKGLVLAGEMDEKEIVKDSYLLVSDVYEKLGDYKNAYKYHSLYAAVKDTLINEDNIRQMAEMKTKYETEKKDREIALQAAEVKKQKVVKYAAITFAVLVILSAIGFVNNMKIRNKVAQLAKANEVRQKISRDLHDEIGAELTTITMLCRQGKAVVLNNGAMDTLLLGKIRSQSESVNEKLSEVVWATNPENDNLPSLVSYMRHYVSQFFDADPLDIRIQYSLDLPDEIPALNLKPDVSRNLFYVLKEALNNCIKHGDADNINISFSFSQDGNYKLKIEDNGKGFNPGEIPLHRSGLGNMRKRIGEIGGSFNIRSENSKGTQIEIIGNFS